MATDKPDMQYAWGEAGDIIEPSDTKIQTGWIAEPPPHQTENWIQNRQDQFLQHINEQGIPVWDSETAYDADAWAKGSDGQVYVSKVATTGDDPISNPSEWVLVLDLVGGGQTQTPIMIVAEAPSANTVNSGTIVYGAVNTWDSETGLSAGNTFADVFTVLGNFGDLLSRFTKLAISGSVINNGGGAGNEQPVEMEFVIDWDQLKVVGRYVYVGGITTGTIETKAISETLIAGNSNYTMTDIGGNVLNTAPAIGLNSTLRTVTALPAMDEHNGSKLTITVENYN